MYILGISCFYHDAAACLLENGNLVAVAQEERFTRKKHDFDFPINAVKFCLEKGGIDAQQIDYVGFYEKPLIKFERILYSHLANFPKSFLPFLQAIPLWLKDKLWIRNIIQKELNYEGEIFFLEHHLCHTASSFLVSPFEESAILTVDGVGEWATATYGKGEDKDITLFKEMRFPHSLGLLYSAFTYYLGFKVNADEYKVMGLAPYGKPSYYELIKKELIKIADDGSFKLNMKYFAFDYGLTMTNRKFNKLFGGLPRKPETEIEQKHKDLASSLQEVTEEIILKMANFVYSQTESNNLCLAGGVALNCVANGRLLKEGPFENIFIQPAAGDAGGAVGAAFLIYNSVLRNKRSFVWEHSFLGPGYSSQEIEDFLVESKIPFKKYPFLELVGLVAGLLADGKVIGWFQDRMEFGPRALGNRSILADPRNPEMKDIINKKIKFREAFRPFAASILAEKLEEYFDLRGDSPYMLLAGKVTADDKIPAVTHIDKSSRIQTVTYRENPLLYDLLKEFHELTGCAVLLNTSFNRRGEPIVCTPMDALDCFMGSGLDYLVMQDLILDKKEMRK
jgi:carbamoyltransferase